MAGLRPQSFIRIVLALTFAAASPALADKTSNGISVGRPKLFDNRSLYIMLEQLNDQLQRLKTIDQEKLVQALAFQQGSEVTEVSRAFTVAGPGSPGVKITEKPDLAGKLAVSEKTTDKSAVTPSALPAPDSLPPPTNTPSFGTAAQDLLSDQVSLTYQIFNVRMLLERALSDRLVGGEPRLQAVLGFQVSLDPPRVAKDHAAFVEITITSDRHRPSLVALMPFEKTYNATALHNRTNAFGGSAVVKLITLGYTERRRGQVFYLYRDSDTLALEYPDRAAEPNSARFGWEFRPVLGRRSVSPGIRQMFAVLALPTADRPYPAAGGETEASGNDPCKGAAPLVDEGGESLRVTVRTYWRRYDRRSLTTESSKFFTQHSYSDESLPVSSTDYVQRRLAPRVDKVIWSTTGPDSATATVEGQNFFTGTRVFLGGKVFDSPSSGLLIKSDRTMELRTSLGDLAFGDVTVSGRYGGASDVAVCARQGGGIRIDQVLFSPDPTREWSDLTVVLRDPQGDRLRLSPDELLMTLGSAVLRPYNSYPHSCYKNPPEVGMPEADMPDADKKCVALTAGAPAAALAKENIVGVRIPFLGRKYSDTYAIYSPELITRVARLGPGKLAITGRGFGTNWKVQIDKTYDTGTGLHIVGSNLMTLTVDDKKIAGYKYLVVTPPKEVPPVLLELPGEGSASERPVLVASAQVETKKDVGGSFTLRGSGLQGIKGVSLEGAKLRFQVLEKGSTIQIILPREATAKVGASAILLELEDGSFVLVPLVVGQ